VTSTIWAARLVVLAAFLDLFCQFPVVAPYAQSLGAGPLLAAIAVATYDATNLVGNLGAGLLLDGWGRRRSLVTGLLVAAGSLVLYGLVATAGQLAIVRGLHGFAQAILSPGAFAVISETVPTTHRARAMGAAGSFIALAAVAGPPLAGAISDRYGPQAVFLSVAAILTAVAVLVSRTPGIAGSAASAVPAVRPRSPWPDGLLRHLRQGPLLAAYVAVVAWTAGIGTLVVHLPLLLHSHGLGAGVRGVAFAAYAAVALLIMVRPAPYLADRMGRIPTLAAGLGVIGLALLWLGQAAGEAVTVGAIYGAMGLFGLGFGLLFPAATALVADATAPRERSAGYGLFYAAYSFGVIAGEIGSGHLAARFGATSGAPFFAGASLALAVTPLVLVLGRTALTPWRAAAIAPPEVSAGSAEAPPAPH
jgi:DHA1 family multidrug resistance protein-like MFS transporter